MKFLNNTEFDFINKQKYTSFLSIVLIIAGIISLVIKGGPILSIDFTGGTIAQLKFNSSVDITELRQKLSKYGFEGSEIVVFGSPDEVLVKTQFSGSSNEINEKIKLLL